MPQAITLYTANRRNATRWREQTLTWDDFAQMCADTQRTIETAAQYRAMSADQQGEIKDVGGFVGAILREGKRKKDYVEARTLITLDLDFATEAEEEWDAFTFNFSNAGLVYSTHKHTPQAPRLRLVVPLARPVSTEEYQALARMVARMAVSSMGALDHTTFDPARLFYWPSTSVDAEFFFRRQDGKFLDPDAFLISAYAGRDHRDSSNWPRCPQEEEHISLERIKAGDPLAKHGIVGDFCRAYTVEEAIDAFLSEVYRPGTTPQRYTYAKGSCANGLVIYDDGRFAYSNHDTDPAGGHCCNAFDLVRIHRFGHLDEGRRLSDDPTRRPSFVEMAAWAVSDHRVKEIQETSAYEDFKEAAQMLGLDTSNLTKEATDWLNDLDTDKNGGYKATANNVVIILENDPMLKGRIRFNELKGLVEPVLPMPWTRRKDVTTWADSDDSELRIYIERVYGISAEKKIKDAFNSTWQKHAFHPVRDYLDTLEWDGTPRLETVVQRHLGADDTPLTRAMVRKHFTAAVARVYTPGCKYDHCLVFKGAQGCGKSTFFNILGGDYFNDSLTTLEGKEGKEEIQGSWLIELAELASTKNSDAESIKAYISRREDKYRGAYTAHSVARPRQCVFCGTTNEEFFLKGTKGNRRFWVVEIKPNKKRFATVKEALEALQKDRDQLLAEAKHYFKTGEELFLPPELEQAAEALTEAHNDATDDPIIDALDAFLATLLPADWAGRGKDDRRAYYRNQGGRFNGEGCAERVQFSAAEFIQEYLGKSPADAQYKYISRRVGDAMRKRPEWESAWQSRSSQVLYGRQRGWRKLNAAHAEAAEKDLETI